MGFTTNALSLPGLLGPSTLVISNEKNHDSLILEMRLSGVAVRVFKHNDVRDAERIARAAIAESKWRRIVLVVEGIYSMEGSIAPLKALVALKRRLRLHLYLDEAHSMGMIGVRGRGITDYAGVDPHDVDILVSTFSKNCNAVGGIHRRVGYDDTKCSKAWLRPNLRARHVAGGSHSSAFHFSPHRLAAGARALDALA